MIGTTELIVIGLIVFVLFGAAAIPKLAKSLGQAKKEFQKGIDDDSDKPSEKEGPGIPRLFEQLFYPEFEREMAKRNKPPKKKAA